MCVFLSELKSLQWLLITVRCSLLSELKSLLWLRACSEPKRAICANHWHAKKGVLSLLLAKNNGLSLELLKQFNIGRCQIARGCLKRIRWIYVIFILICNAILVTFHILLRLGPPIVVVI